MIPFPGYFWPPGASRSLHPDALRNAFEVLGYELTNTPDLEVGYEKVALYVDSRGQWSHAAKQNLNGEWSSKMGDAEDIAHKSPNCFSGSIYGEVCCYMRRMLPEEERAVAESHATSQKGEQ